MHRLIPSAVVCLFSSFFNKRVCMRACDCSCLYRGLEGDSVPNVNGNDLYG